MNNNKEKNSVASDSLEDITSEEVKNDEIRKERVKNILTENNSPVPQRNISRRELVDAINEHLLTPHDRGKRIACEKNVVRWIDQILDKYPEHKGKYRMLFLYSNGTLDRSAADSIHRALAEYSIRGVTSDPIMLLLHSPGGYPGPAYLIGKMLQEASKKNLEIVVPRWAKSAATLMCCSASHIHMGRLSELGPIDPQVGDPPMPALGLKVAIEHIVDLVENHPESKDLFIGYMVGKVDPMHLGYFDRASASAIQYAERLLNSGAHGIDIQQASQIAARLVHGYMDHGFVIDKEEALQVFGKDMVLSETKEYELSEKLYNELSYIEFLAHRRGFNFSLIGSPYTGIQFVKRGALCS